MHYYKGATVVSRQNKHQNKNNIISVLKSRYLEKALTIFPLLIKG